ncbi:hypothetical protein, partial [Xanthomonas oryzae]|uniref:hypothetical protein n=1 Tax=Xanthomonas oryzae TaxID=347 RepID=UPI00211B1F10
MHGNGGQGESSPNLRRQLNGYLALNVDLAIRDNIERNAPVQGVGYGLHYGADLARATGHAVQGVDAGVESIVAPEKPPDRIHCKASPAVLACWN